MSTSPEKKPHLPKLAQAAPDKVGIFYLPIFWGAVDPQLVAQSMETAAQRVEPGYHFGDNLFTWCRNISMLEDPEFVRSWSENAETDMDRAIMWRRYVLACAAYHCVQLRGDFVECGVYTGVSVKGTIPDVFALDSPSEIAYLHIDLNEAAAEVAALEALFDRIVPGGIVVLDDYEWAGAYRAQKLAEDPWFEARHYRVIPLPTGQGIVVKR